MGIRGGGASDGSAIGRIDYSYFSYLERLDMRGWPGDEQEAAMAFIRQAGLGTADPNLIRVLVQNAVQAAENLDKWGLVFRNQWSKSPPRRFKPMPGLGYLVRGSGARIMEGVMLIEILVHDGRCIGALGVREETGEPFVIKAKSVILGTGGYAQLFLLNCHESGLTGDGHAIGYEAGAPLMNMEFMQVMPAVIHPSIVLLSCTFWKLYPTFKNRLGDEILDKYLPEGISVTQVFDERQIHSPFSTRDKASRYIEIAMCNEFREGLATEKKGFYLEIEDVEKMVGESPEWLRYRGIDWKAGNQQCNAIFHASNGGLIIDESGQSQIPGLYALGETATGPHGTDRPGGHMMGASQVFGMLAGRHAGEQAGKTMTVSVNNAIAEKGLSQIAILKEARGDLKPSAVKQKLRKTAYEHMLVLRSKKSLSFVLSEIQKIREEQYPCLSVENPRELIEALELKNLLTVGELIARTALMREETRGSHFRLDYPERDDINWSGIITVCKGDGEPRLERRVIDPKWKDRPGDMGQDPWG
jgi:succinate dehydrogenase/fumarate reductase flavoprotein subunit